MNRAVAPRGFDIVSIGHGSRTLEEMLRILQARGITCVVDVRRFPTSRKFPHFAGAAMRRWLAEARVEYVQMGETLGGYRTGGYEAWMQTARFEAGLEALIERALQERQAGGLVAFMCSERLPWRCHRRFIARALARRGLSVLHVIDERRDWAPGGEDQGATPPEPRSG